MSGYMRGKARIKKMILESTQWNMTWFRLSFRLFLLYIHTFRLHNTAHTAAAAWAAFENWNICRVFPSHIFFSLCCCFILLFINPNAFSTFKLHQQCCHLWHIWISRFFCSTKRARMTFWERWISSHYLSFAMDKSYSYRCGMNSFFCMMERIRLSWKWVQYPSDCELAVRLDSGHKIWPFRTLEFSCRCKLDFSINFAHRNRSNF